MYVCILMCKLKYAAEKYNKHMNCTNIIALIYANFSGLTCNVTIQRY